MCISQKPEEIVGCPGAEVRDDCELACMGPGNWTCVLCNGSK